MHRTNQRRAEVTLPKDILPQVTAGELDAFSTIGGEERLIAFVNRFRELERERIIKLLESRIQGCKGYNCETCDEQSGLIAALALIKGEQK